MAKLTLTAGIGIARAPPHQKVGDSYTFHITPARIRATPRRAVVRGLLAKIASAEFKDISAAEYKARKITLSKGMLPPVAAVVAEKLHGAYPDSLRAQTEAAFMTKRKTKHAAAAGAVARGAKAAAELGVSVGL
jgi:hypothetical protein